jgi:hypothetical protein
MSTEIVIINEAQKDALKVIVKGRVNIEEAGLDKRTINALERRELVKITENSKGLFAAATAKGKKALN